MLFRPGEQIGPYVLVRQLGRGAFGSVWLAQEQSLFDRHVALKLPLEEDPDLEEIKREARTWLRAGYHPNLVPVLSANVYDGQVAIASEYVSGGTLTQWLTQSGGKAPSIEAATVMISGILSGLEHLHSLTPHPLIHRDLKPANVLLDEEKQTPRITDFGVSRILKSAASSNISGTPAYMAPEMFEGHYSVQSDLWAAGIIFYVMLAGSLPFTAQNMIQLARSIERDIPNPLPQNVPTYLRDVLAHTLQKDPTRRFTSAQAMRQALSPPVIPARKPTVFSVFVSHSSKDKVVADAVSAVLEDNGIGCWIAPRNIVPGKPWGEAIVEAIRQSSVMVLVFSQDANDSQQVMREVERAAALNKPIIPFRIANVLPSGSLEYFLSAQHWLDAFTPPIETHFIALIETIRQLLPGESILSTEISPPSTTSIGETDRILPKNVDDPHTLEPSLLATKTSFSTTMSLVSEADFRIPTESPDSESVPKTQPDWNELEQQPLHPLDSSRSVAEKSARASVASGNWR